MCACLCYPLRGHTYASSGAKFSSIPIHVLRYVLARREKFAGNGPATGYRFILYPVPGRFVLRPGPREVAFCLGGD